MVVGFYGERTKNWFSLHLCTEVHVMRRMFNLDIYVIKYFPFWPGLGFLVLSLWRVESGGHFTFRKSCQK